MNANTSIQALFDKAVAPFDELWGVATDGGEREFLTHALLEWVDRGHEALLDALLAVPELRARFFRQSGQFYIFKAEAARLFIEKRQINHSYTQYKNRIGLTDGKRFIADTQDVVLNFPFKDGVLQGGQRTDEGEVPTCTIDDAGDIKTGTAKRNEVFFNEVIAQDEIDQLNDPKAFVKWRRYDQAHPEGTEDVGELAREADGTLAENLIIKGNNYLALQSLMPQFRGKVKLIYIDPPYNTGSDSFKYNDRFNHSTWLVFMKNRLELARQLLREDGVIFVQCDDNEQAYLKVLMDEVFGRDKNEVTFYVQVRFGGKTLTLKNPYQKLIELVFVYSKGNFDPILQTEKYTLEKFCWEFQELKQGKQIQLGGRKTTVFKPGEYKLVKTKPGANKLKETWATGTVTTGNASGKFFDTFISKRLQEDGLGCLYKVEGIGEDGFGYRYFTGAKREGATKGKFYSGVPLKRLEELQKGEATKFNPILNYMDFKEEYGNSRTQGGIQFGTGKKPEQFLQKIIEVSTTKNDIVLDYHLGSGTTAAVAHKMGRRYIGIEQMDYIEDIAVARLQKVIAGEQGGVSKAVGWHGGGGFVYGELAVFNEAAKKKINACASPTELTVLFDELAAKYFLNYTLSVKAFREEVMHEPVFQALSLDEQKRMVAMMLDANQLYVPKTDMADSQYGISKTDQALTAAFYTEPSEATTASHNAPHENKVL